VVTRSRPARLATGIVVVVVVVAVALGAAACGDDGAPEGDAAPTTAAPSAGPGDLGPHASPEPDPGDLEIEVPDGYVGVPLPSLGIGLAIPRTWEAVVLTEEALERVEAVSANPGFVDAARNARASGALLYGAGIDAEGRVSDLKVSQVPGLGLDAAADAAASAAPEGATVDRPGAGANPAVRVRFAVEAIGPDGEAIVAEGTQWLVQGPEAVWSLVVTSEDPSTHDDLARALLDTVVFSPSR
jgi:hypothetical protein